MGVRNKWKKEKSLVVSSPLRNDSYQYNHIVLRVLKYLRIVQQQILLRGDKIFFIQSIFTIQHFNKCLIKVGVKARNWDSWTYRRS
jgi:hypothetical protein